MANKGECTVRKKKKKSCVLNLELWDVGGGSGQVVRVREILNHGERLGVRGDMLQWSQLKLGVSGSHTERGVEGWSQLRIWVER